MFVVHNIENAWWKSLIIIHQVAYLESKNIVDRASMDSELWNGVLEELLQLREGEIQIVDVGARILSMLDLFLHGDSKVGL